MASWIIGQDAEVELRAMYERHYSAYKYKDGRKPAKFVGPGEHLVLTTPRRTALFVWRKFTDDTIPPQEGINCSIFRNEGAGLSSDLIREADAIADFGWADRRHYTCVCASSIKSRNPWFCFIQAGWKRCGVSKGGLVILERVIGR